VPYLYVLNGRQRHKVFPVGSKAAGEVLGLRDDADVVLRDPWISWTHAKVSRDEGGAVAIEDLGSTNGTYVNCERVVRRTLAEDDVVFLGRTHLLFVASDRAPSAPPPGILRSSSDARPQRATEGTTRLESPQRPHDLHALDASTDSALDSGSAHPHAALRELEATGALRSPFADAGPLRELEDDEDEDGLPLPPTAELAYADARPREDGVIEIDIADLFADGPEEGGAVGTAPPSEAVQVHSLADASGEIDPLALCDREIQELRAALAARDAEVQRLRAEILRLKQHYIDQ